MRFNTKEKAKELFSKFEDLTYHQDIDEQVKCTLLCVDEVIETLYDEGYNEFDDKIIRWLEVKDELETFN